MRACARLCTIGLLLGAACGTDALPFETNDAGVVDLAPPPHVPKDKVDILFMMDDSAGAPKQQRLRTAFPEMIAAFDASLQNRPISYHIGVVTSDLGAPGITCGRGTGAQLKPKGAATTNCSGPSTGNFLVYDQLDPSNTNLPAGQDLAATFTCMASVGDKGCGFEMPLEAVYRALHDPIFENVGFLRDDAVLAVILLTDEDDCSADPTSDLFGPALGTTYGPLTSFRCAKFGVSCDGRFPLPDTSASYTSCQPATTAQGNKLTPIERYIDFFTKPRSAGGVKEDPRDVLLAAIDGPSSPFTVGAGTSPDVCGRDTQTCPVLGHSCRNPVDASFFADPAVRINAVLAASPGSITSSVCGSDDSYKATLLSIGQRILAATE